MIGYYFCLYLIYRMARIIPTSKQQISISKIITKDIEASTNEHLTLIAKGDDYFVKCNDLFLVDKIDPLTKSSVEIDNLKVKQINGQEYTGGPINHNHTNLETLENLTNDVIENSHNHENLTTLSNITDEIIENSHKHENLTTLSNITNEIIENSHNHENLTTLNNVTDEIIQKSHSHS